MSFRRDDLAPLLVVDQGEEFGFHTGTVTAWDTETGANTLEVAGAPLADVPTLNTGGTVEFRVGDVVAVLRFRSSYFILGRITTPGEEFGAGGMRIRGEGRWYDEQYELRMILGRTGPNVVDSDGAQLVRFLYLDNQGRGRVHIGAIEDASENTFDGHGLLVEYGNGSDALMVIDDTVRLGRPDGTGILGVSNNNEYDDYIWLKDLGGADAFYADRQNFYWAKNGAFTFQAEAAGKHSIIYGGQTDNGNAFRAMLEFRGGSTNAREIWARDGARSTWIPLGASDFVVKSSSRETKTVLGDAGPALEAVRSTPIKRWQHTARPCDSDGGSPEEPPVRVGPMVEDVPEELANWSGEEGGINLAASVWTLWRAVQELSEEVDQLRAELQQKGT